jgi:hypothetical protein
MERRPSILKERGSGEGGGQRDGRAKGEERGV